MKLTTFDKTLITFLVGLIAFVLNLFQTDGGWTASDTIALLGWLSSTGLVYFTPNKKSTDPTTSTPDI